MAKVKCHACNKDWDSAIETESAEWFEVTVNCYKPVCPPCHRLYFAHVPKQAARSGRIGFSSRPTYTAPIKRAALPLPADDPEFQAGDE